MSINQNHETNGPREQASAELEEKRDRERMREFIEKNGGSVRFDQYMTEHVFGGEGYYTKHAKIGEDFTTYALLPEFATLIAAHVKDQGNENRTFLELAGGTGVFKSNFLQVSPNVNYMSVEGSPKLVRLQHEAGTQRNTIQADARALPLQSASVEGTIFANELLEALPARVFTLKRDEQGKMRIVKEGVVEPTTDTEHPEELEFVERPVSPDALTRQYEQFLNETGRTFEDGQQVTVPTNLEAVFLELNRVLKSGEVVLPDYGFTDEELKAGKNPPTTPYWKNGPIPEPPIMIVNNPYKVDITFMLDFDYCKWLLRKINPDLQVECQVQSEFLNELNEKHQLGFRDNDDPNNPRPLFKEKGGFKVLRIIKNASNNVDSR